MSSVISTPWKVHFVVWTKNFTGKISSFIKAHFVYKGTDAVYQTVLDQCIHAQSVVKVIT